MLNRKQIFFISSALVLLVVLLSMDIKGLVKPKEPRTTNAPAEQAAPKAQVNLQTVSESAKLALKGNLSTQITELEEQLASANADQKTSIQKQLAQKWEDVNQPGPAAFYYEELAAQAKSISLWLKAGDRFTEAYEASSDTLSQPSLVEKAMNAYKKVLELQPENLDAKTGLGIAYVSGSGAPMEGIVLLKSVVAADPDNLKANMSLGKFSMTSGQFDKAVERFKTVVKVKPSAEAWFYMASSYENLGMKKEAISAFVKSKELAADPGMSTYVDKKVAELKK